MTSAPAVPTYRDPSKTPQERTEDNLALARVLPVGKPIEELLDALALA